MILRLVKVGALMQTQRSQLMYMALLVVFVTVFAACSKTPRPSTAIPTAQGTIPSAAGAVTPSPPSMTHTAIASSIDHTAGTEPTVIQITALDRIITPTIQPLPYPPGDITAMHWADALHGWIGVSDAVRQTEIGIGGILYERTAPTHSAILGTSDGGQTWTAQYETTSEITSLHFISPFHGWAGTEDGLLVTTDGGRRWSLSINEHAPDVTRVQFVDNQHGWIAVGKNDFWRTRDGGQTWVEFTNPCALYARSAINPFSFIDTEHGWIVCGGGLNAYTQDIELLKTEDGGQKWSKVEQDHSKDPRLTRPSDGYTGRDYDAVSNLHFLDNQRGWISTGDNNLLATTDGGVSWQITHVPAGSDQYLRSGHFISPTHGFVVSTEERAVLLSTLDGGNTWRQLFPAPTPIWPELVFWDTQHGIGLGTVLDRAAVLTTEDGGRSWQQISSLSVVCPGQAFALSFPDKEHGWVIHQCSGQSDTTRKLERTTDGGRTWTTLGTRIGSAGYWHVHFMNDRRGYVTSSTGGVVVSTDGGSTFRVAKPSTAIEQSIGGPQTWHFVTDMLWWKEINGKYYRTTDGGQSWIPATLPERIHRFGVLSNGTGWYWINPNCASECPSTAIRTHDDGRTWVQYTFGDIRVTRLTFIDARYGWLTTEDDHIYGTADGGVTWTQLH